MRGLKQKSESMAERNELSHLLQMRGLKLCCIGNLIYPGGSHLLQMRGLKPLLQPKRFARRVASFTDAWIETWFPRRLWYDRGVASFTDAWIETVHWLNQTGKRQSHLLQMRGLKQQNNAPDLRDLSRIFYRCVDWNKLRIRPNVLTWCRIFYRCVDWNNIIYKFVKVSESRIFYRCVDWNVW